MRQLKNTANILIVLAVLAALISGWEYLRPGPGAAPSLKFEWQRVVISPEEYRFDVTATNHGRGTITLLGFDEGCTALGCWEAPASLRATLEPGDSTRFSALFHSSSPAPREASSRAYVDDGAGVLKSIPLVFSLQ